MRLEYKQFDFEETLREIDSVVDQELEEMTPMNQFLPISQKGGDIECAYAGAIAVSVRLSVYDNNYIAGLGKAYELVKLMLLDIFRDNSDCLDVICMGRSFCGIFQTLLKSNIDGLIDTMAKLNAALTVLDMKLSEKYKIHVMGNCGCDFGELFRIRSSYKDSAEEKVFESWHGAPLNMAIIFSEHARKNDKNGTIISENVRSNIKDEYKKFFEHYDDALCGYWASLVDSDMFKWVKSNR